MVTPLITISVFVITAFAEKLHMMRYRRTGRLAFGPGGEARPWTAIAPYLRVVCITALAWSLLTLLEIAPKVFAPDEKPENIARHVVVVLDVSPSMKIVDSGIDRNQSRAERASEVLSSIFSRIRRDQVGISVIAFYSGALPVVIDTTDMEVIRNILDRLPLDYAFDFGKTKLIEGINAAARHTGGYADDTATVVVVSDGDTLPDTGMSQMPSSVAKTLIIGVGSREGAFLDGHQSRQDGSSLRSVARRLGGQYYDANIRHLPTEALRELAEAVPMTEKKRFGRREVAMALALAGSFILAILPVALNLIGSGWHENVRSGND